MNKKTAQQFIFLLVIVILAACAKISSPTGGARDRIPPEVVESNPENGTVNFSGDRISVTFDEFVVLDNINEKFMVSPPMKNKPRVYTRGKSVRIDYEDELRDSTTYTFYFMDAIRDLNEGNILPNFRIAVSTGTFIDSLSVTGNVYASPSLDIPEGTSVLLYQNHDDTAVVKTFPDYISRVDETGYFRIDNVREGRYRLYALKDEDNSKNYNRVEEPFGFLDTIINVTPEKNYIPDTPDTVKTIPAVIKKTPPPPVKITKTTTSGAQSKEEPLVPLKTGEHQIIMFSALKTARYLAGSSRPNSYKLIYILSVPPDTMDFSFTMTDIPEDKYFIEKTPLRDTVTVWITDSTIYSKPSLETIVKYPFTDSLGIHGYKQDTISMRFTTPRSTRGTPKKSMLVLKNNVSGGTLKPGQKIIFTSETPLKDPDTSMIRLFEIADKKRLKVPFSFEKDSSYLGKLILNTRLAEGKEYIFIADSASISNIFDHHIDSTGFRAKVRETSSYSKLEISITNAEGKSIIELLDNTEKLVARSFIEGDGRVVFSLLEKGAYRIRAISDLNRDGQYTTGDYFEKRQPEPVTYFPKVLEIPEGWDTNEKWDMSEKNYKPQVLRPKLKNQ